MFKDLPENPDYGLNDIKKSDFIVRLLNLKAKYGELIDASVKRFRLMFGISPNENVLENAEELHAQTCIYCSCSHRDLTSCGFHQYSVFTSSSKKRLFGRYQNGRVRSTNGVFCSLCMKTIDLENIVRHFALRDYQAVLTEMFYINKDPDDRYLVLNQANEKVFGYDDDPDTFYEEERTQNTLRLSNAPALLEKARLNFLLFDFICLSFTLPLSSLIRDIIMIIYFFLSSNTPLPDYLCISSDQIDALDELLGTASSWDKKFKVPEYFYSSALLRKAVWRKGASLIIQTGLNTDDPSSNTLKVGFDKSYSGFLIHNRSYMKSVIDMEKEINNIDGDRSENVGWIYELHDYFMRWYVRGVFESEFKDFLKVDQLENGNYRDVVFKQMRTKIQYILQFPFDSAISYNDIQDVLQDKRNQGEEDSLEAVVQFVYAKILTSWVSFDPGAVANGTPRFLVSIKYDSWITAVLFSIIDSSDSNKVTIIAYLLPKCELGSGFSGLHQYFVSNGYDINVILKRINPVGRTQNLCFINAIMNTAKSSITDLLTASKNRGLTHQLNLDNSSFVEKWISNLENRSAATFLEFLRSIS